MASLSYIYGDVTDPQTNSDRPAIIPHVVNDAGVMGAGVAKALYTRWPVVKSAYLKWNARQGLELGDVQDVWVLPGSIYVCNMIAQSSPGRFDNVDVWREDAGWVHTVRPPIRYGALSKAMRHVAAVTSQVSGSIHAPMFGSGLAGGEWGVIEQIILELWVGSGIDVTIYEYES